MLSVLSPLARADLIAAIAPLVLLRAKKDEVEVTVDGTAVPAPWTGWAGPGLAAATGGSGVTVDYRLTQGAAVYAARAGGKRKSRCMHRLSCVRPGARRLFSSGGC